MIAQKYLSIRQNIDNEILIVVVSKTRTTDEIMQLYNIGVRDFGENRVAELLDKYEKLPKDIRWHFIGTLQTKKVKKIIDKIDTIHSVDNIKLLTEIAKKSELNSNKTKVLIQFHLAEENSKQGFEPNKVNEIIQDLKTLNINFVNIIGVMTMATNTDDIKKIKSEFENMYKISEKFKTEFDNCDKISMGMSNDYKIAIDCGSNILRLGSIFF